MNDGISFLMIAYYQMEISNHENEAKKMAKFVNIDRESLLLLSYDIRD